MNRHLSYLPEFSALCFACGRLRQHVRNSGRDVAAFHVPSRMLSKLEHRIGSELRDLTMYGKPVYRHDGSGGIIAEKGRSFDFNERTPLVF
jgi:hypothetical protein